MNRPSVQLRIAFIVLAGAVAGGTPRVLAQNAAGVAALMREPSVQAALEAAKTGEAKTIEDQIRFCEVPAPPFQEHDRAVVLQREFTQLGLANVRVDAAGNVLGDRRGTAPRPRVVIAAHLDTVFPPDTIVKVTRQGSILRGPGIGDNCRGLAVLVAIVRSLNQGAVRTPGTITFVANVGEEGLGDLRGMKALFGETMKDQIDRFVSIDNAGINVSIVGVGSHRYRITFNGPGGHSFAQFGVANPANALGRAVARIAELKVPSDPRTTFNVGRIGGGTAVNAIPSEAWMEIDLRSSDPAQLASLDRSVQQAIDRAVVDENARWGTSGAITVTKTLVGDRPAGSISVDSPIVQTALAAARAIGSEALLSEASSDANLPMGLHIPAIAIGAGGRSSNSHSADETFDMTDAWKGTQHALLLSVALAR
jgi:tripeptide aminopeptidase